MSFIEAPFKMGLVPFANPIQNNSVSSFFVLFMAHFGVINMTLA
jgi:hypothetical protein